MMHVHFRQELSRELEGRHLRCKCIRCREVKDEQFDLGLAASVCPLPTLCFCCCAVETLLGLASEYELCNT